MKNYLKLTHQNYQILEIWVAENGIDYFVIFKRKNDISWGAFYNVHDGYHAYGHYDFETLRQARLNMLEMYKNYNLDLFIKNVYSFLMKNLDIYYFYIIIIYWLPFLYEECINSKSTLNY